MSQEPYRRLSPLTPVVRSFIFVAAVVATTWDDVLRGDVGPIAWILLGLLLAGAVYGAASWLLTKFWIEADELRVDTGVINRQSRRIRIDRLQGVDIVQPFVARLFGLAELRMDVAGSSAREGSLAFLRLSDARDLKDLLLARRDAVRAHRADPDGTTHAPDAIPQETGRPRPVVPERLLARVDLGMLVASILLSGETVALLLTGVALSVLFVFTGEWAGLPAMLPVLGGIVLVQFRKLAAHYNFTVTESAAGMQVRRGLFELSSQTIALARLQGVVVTEPLLWRTLGWARVDVSIAGYASASDGTGPAASTVLPVGPRGLAMQLVRHLLDGADPDRITLTAPPKRAAWAAPVGWRFMLAGADSRIAVSRQGWLTRRTHMAPHARVQSLRITQGPWQRRLRLADLHLDSPPGPVDVRVRHRSAADIRHILEREAVVARRARALRAAHGSGAVTPGVVDTTQ